ncbi:Uncharacterised protein [Mycobacteroides abscessus subsp. abscessus]|nr:Uncharacterised protein [Mycobacteroides abscessus subsp. abscessus]
MNRLGIKTVRFEGVAELLQRCRRHRLGPIDDRVDVRQVQRRFALLGHTAQRAMLEGEVRQRREATTTVLALDGHFPQPAQWTANKRRRTHHGHVLAEHRRHHHGDQAHVMEERQPGAATQRLVSLRAFLRGQRVDQLQQVGGHIEVSDLHTGGGPGRARGVLQIRDGVLGRHRLDPGRPHIVGNRIDRDDTGALLGRAIAEELAHPLGTIGGGQHRRRLAIIEHRMQAPGMTGLARIEQRHRNRAGVQRTEMCHQVIKALRSQDGHTVTRLGHLLQTRRHRTVTRTELRPRDVDIRAITLRGKVQETVRQALTL